MYLLNSFSYCVGGPRNCFLPKTDLGATILERRYLYISGPIRQVRDRAFFRPFSQKHIQRATLSAM